MFAFNGIDWLAITGDAYTDRVSWMPRIGLELAVGVNQVSGSLVLLTLLLGPITVACSKTAITERVRTYYGWLLVLQSAMIAVFVARDVVLFYIAFEFTLIPMFVLISLFGGANRKAAAVKFFLYTFTGSVIALAGILYVAWYYATKVSPPSDGFGGTWSFNLDTLKLAARRMSPQEQWWVFAALMLGFAVKVPLFPLHTWLPLAHTEAPTAGSVVLAGVLLKLGTYAIYEIAVPMVPGAAVSFAPVVAVLAIVGFVLIGLVCWVQHDVKKLVAYSSVAHLGVCILGLFSFNQTGLKGSLLYMINHGLSTGALFLLIGMMYERYHTRNMNEIGGLAKKMPVWAAFMVFFAMASVGLPGLNGFVSEFMCLMGAWQAGGGTWGDLPGATPGVLGPWYVVVAGVGMVVAAMYTLLMVGKVVWGPLKTPHDEHAGHVHSSHAHAGHDDHGHASPLPTDLSAREIGTLVPLAALCLLLGLYPKPLLQAFDHSTRQTHELVVQAIQQRQARPLDTQPPGTPARDTLEPVNAGPATISNPRTTQ
jgi:NADH-quinone oxidoreductase subunit M